MGKQIVYDKAHQTILVSLLLLYYYAAAMLAVDASDNMAFYSSALPQGATNASSLAMERPSASASPSVRDFVSGKLQVSNRAPRLRAPTMIPIIRKVMAGDTM